MSSYFNKHIVLKTLQGKAWISFIFIPCKVMKVNDYMLFFNFLKSWDILRFFLLYVLNLNGNLVLVVYYSFVKNMRFSPLKKIIETSVSYMKGNIILYLRQYFHTNNFIPCSSILSTHTKVIDFFSKLSGLKGIYIFGPVFSGTLRSNKKHNTKIFPFAKYPEFIIWNNKILPSLLISSNDSIVITSNKGFRFLIYDNNSVPQVIAFGDNYDPIKGSNSFSTSYVSTKTNYLKKAYEGKFFYLVSLVLHKLITKDWNVYQACLCIAIIIVAFKLCFGFEKCYYLAFNNNGIKNQELNLKSEVFYRINWSTFNKNFTNPIDYYSVKYILTDLGFLFDQDKVSLLGFYSSYFSLLNFSLSFSNIERQVGRKLQRIIPILLDVELNPTYYNIDRKILWINSLNDFIFYRVILRKSKKFNCESEDVL